MNESLAGKNIIESYGLHKTLSNENRNDLINIIVEEIVRKDVALRAQDFSMLLTDICEIFPTERQVKVNFI